MAKYYTHDGINRQGPFDKDGLRSQGIKSTTPVWTDGMTDWMEAGKVEELQDLFVVPPPFKASGSVPPPVSAKQALAKKGSGRTILVVVLVVALLGVGAIIWAANTGGNTTGGFSYEEKVMTVEEIERADPTRFLDASGTYNENFWGNKLKVLGIVKSNATVAQYKDVIIQVTYYSETKTVLGTDSYVLYKFVPPHGEIAFEWTLNRPNACKTIGWEVTSATPI